MLQVQSATAPSAKSRRGSPERRALKNLRGNMARWTIGSYNRFLGASMSRYGLARRQAAQHYREMRGNLKRSVTRADIANHPRISKRTAAWAFAKRPPIEKPAKRVKVPLLPPVIPKKVMEEEQDQEKESSEDYEA